MTSINKLLAKEYMDVGTGLTEICTTPEIDFLTFIQWTRCAARARAVAGRRDSADPGSGDADPGRVSQGEFWRGGAGM
jgi:hypothetical protein